MLGGTWTIKRVDKLADEFGITQRTVYNSRKRIIERRREEAEQVDPAAMFDDWLARLRLGQSLALAEKQTANYGRLLRTEAQVLGFDKGAHLTVQHVGHDGGAVKVDVQHNVQQVIAQLPTMSDAQLEALARLDEEGTDVIDTDDEGRPLLGRPGDDAGASAGDERGGSTGSAGSPGEAQGRATGDPAP